MGKIPSQSSQKTIRVLVLTPFYAPDFGPSAPIFTALCEDLQKAGYEVTVVAGFPHYGNAAELFPYPGKLFVREKINGVNLIRFFVYAVPKSSLGRRLIYHGLFNLFATLACLAAGRTDVILADAPSLWYGLPLLVRALIPGTPYIYIIHDIYPDVLIKLDVIHSHRMVNLIERVEAFFYKNAARISVLSDGFKENLTRKGVPDKKIEVIPVCVDVDFVRPLDCHNELCREWGLEGKFVVLYAGNLGLSQSLEYVIETARQLAALPAITFVMVGDGARKTALQELVDEYCLENVRFFPFQPREKVPLIYALAQVCLVSLDPHIVAELVPSKTFTIMAAGRPLIATVDRHTEVGRLLEQSGCGVRVEPENPDELAKVITRLYQDQNLLTRMGTNGREYVVAHFSDSVANKMYQNLIFRSIAEH